MLKIDKINVDSVLATMALLLLLGGGAWAYSLYGENEKLAPVLAAKQSELQAVKAKLHLLPRLQREKEASQAETEYFLQYVPSREEQEKFIRELETMVARNELNLQNIQILPQPVHYKDLSQYAVYQWKLSLQGSFSGLNRFLEEVDQAERFLKVSDLSVNGQAYPQPGEPVKQNLKHYPLDITLTIDLITKSTGKESHEKTGQ
ncbi:pilus assembly protein PilO [Hydrogenispora ethanolica]|uniref:Pilus assembly protein PilO n=1 Tax=Hydrogenispora ethanolica TaxID=1082276 RepID=A0A4R1RMD3_HYDET|nr:type 4a pilus biogenesis protein PilO [Hydrogenispora ethanolica]TCL67433.1 pilus assembly protein PilO [Hydrogenispora ethanolica]